MPFYASGLKFSCKRCSSCCRYDAGYVFLSEKDMEKLLAGLKMDRNSFIRTYCRWVTDRNGKNVLSLKEKSNNDCILWDSGCLVYMNRPIQCITFPFWDNILFSAENWDIAASGCPGMNSGALHTEKAINDFVKMRSAAPIIKKSGETETFQARGGN